MKVCGIELKASEAIIALVERQGDTLVHVPINVKKLGLEDDEDARQVRDLYQRLGALVAEHGIQRIALKKRGKKGEFAGGPVTFKIEGLLQLLDGCDVELLSPQTINAANRKHGFDLPAGLNKYQHDAFLAACTLFNRKG